MLWSRWAPSVGFERRIAEEGVSCSFWLEAILTYGDVSFKTGVPNVIPSERALHYREGRRCKGSNAGYYRGSVGEFLSCSSSQ